MSEKPAFTNKELTAAVQELNKVIETGKIKHVGKKSVDIVSGLKNAIVKLNDDGKVDLIPDSVLDFYNTYLAEDEESSTEEKPEVKPAAKKTTVKPATAKTTVVKKGTKPEVKPEVKSAAKKGAEKPETKPVVKTDAKPPAKATGESGKKDGKKNGKTKSRSRDENGVVAKAVQAYQSGIRSTKELTDHLAPMFPDRPIASTISHVVCILGHVKFPEK